MIVCRKCGFENEDSDAFCGSCASFLEWEGQRVGQEAEPEPAPEPEPEEEAHQGLIERVKEKIGIGDDRPAEAPAAAEEAEPDAVPAVPNGAPATPQPEPVAAAAGAPAPVSSAPLAAAAAPGPVSGLAPSGSVAAAPSPPVPAGPVAAGVATAPPVAKGPASPEVAPAPAVAAPASAVSAPTTVSRAGAPSTTAPPPQPVAPVAPAAKLVPPRPAAPAPAPASGGGGAPGAVLPGPVQPEAVKPGAVKTRPTAKKAAPTREINPGDKICGQCGEGNDPIRKFCRRCGGSLVEATVFKLPWYKAFWRRLTQGKQKQAGHRPKMRRRAFGGHGGWLSSWLLRIIVLAVVAFIVLSFVGPWHKSLHKREAHYWNNIVGVVHPTYNPFFAQTAEASSSAPGHPAQNLIDGNRLTSWQSNGSPTNQEIVVRFPTTANVAKIGFDIGDQDTPDAFQTQPRPAKIKMTFNGPVRVEKTVNLRDVTGFQTFNVSSKNSSGVTIIIEGVHAATGNGQNVSIAQIEFFTKN